MNICNNYRRVPYHHFTHAFSLTSVAYWILKNIEKGHSPDSKEGMYRFFSKDDILAIVLGCVGHDVNHPGMNNGYLSKTKDDLSNLWARFHEDDTITTISESDLSSHVLESFGMDNKNSILENMHLKITRYFMDILPDEKADSVIQTIAECVLWTDMSKHGTLVDKLKALGDKFKATDSYSPTQDERTFLAAMIVHACDLSGQILDFDHSMKWGMRIAQEFHDQFQAEDNLDKEECGPPLGFLKYTSAAAFKKSQAGFWENIILPMWKELYDILKFDKVVIENIERNIRLLLEGSQ